MAGLKACEIIGEQKTTIYNSRCQSFWQRGRELCVCVCVFWVAWTQNTRWSLTILVFHSLPKFLSCYPDFEISSWFSKSFSVDSIDAHTASIYTVIILLNVPEAEKWFVCFLFCWWHKDLVSITSIFHQDHEAINCMHSDFVGYSIGSDFCVCDKSYLICKRQLSEKQWRHEPWFD